MSQKNVKAARKASPAVLKSKLSPLYPGSTPGSVEVALGGTKSKVDIYALKNLPASVRSWVFELFERNMKALYEDSEDGYDPKEKRQELFDPESRFVVLGSPPLAYAVFRFDGEETAGDREAEVVYCYEVQVEESARGTGAGKALMDILAQLGKQFAMEKVMLTVLKANEAAVQFYDKIGYATDEICPSKYDNPDVDYWILSKPCK